MKGYIYLITNMVNNKQYVGQTVKTIEKRWKRHCSDSFNMNSSSYNLHFHRAIKNYGKESFEVEQLLCCDEKDLNNAEIYFIEHYDTFNNGYNLTLGGEGNSGFICSDETKQKISKANKGKSHTEETKKKISEAKKSIKLSEEHINKLCKPIIQFSKSGEFIKEWSSTSEAAREIAISRSNISTVITGNRKTAGGFIWRYKN